MKLIEVVTQNTNKQITLAQKLERMKFTVELTGVDILALKIVAGHIGGVGALRKSLSYDVDVLYNESGLESVIPSIGDFRDNSNKSTNTIYFKANALESIKVDE
jgi:hypothetical protein